MKSRERGERFLTAHLVVAEEAAGLQVLECERHISLAKALLQLPERVRLSRLCERGRNEQQEQREAEFQEIHTTKGKNSSLGMRANCAREVCNKVHPIG